MKTKRFRLFAFSLVVLTGFLYAWFFILSELTHKPFGIFSEPQRYFLAFGDTGYSEPNAVDLHAWLILELPNWTDRTALALEIPGVTFEYNQNDAELAADEICIEQLLTGTMDEFFLKSKWNFSYISSSNDLIDKVGKVCRSISGQNERELIDFSEYPGIEENDRRFVAATHFDSFHYPYDGLDTVIVVQVKYSLRRDGELLKEGTVIPLMYLALKDGTSAEQDWDISVDIKYSEWTKQDQERFEMAVEDENISFGHDEHTIREGRYSSFDIKLSRPILPRLAFPFFTIVLALLIAILTFIDELGSFLEGTVAILFSIFGLRQILVPANAEGARTVIDTVILGLYALFAIAFLLFIIPILVDHFRTREPPQRTALTKYVAVRGLEVYHSPTCRTIASTSTEHLLEFADEQSATNTGRRQCKICLRAGGPR